MGPPPCTANVQKWHGIAALGSRYLTIFAASTESILPYAPFIGRITISGLYAFAASILSGLKAVISCVIDNHIAYFNDYTYRIGGKLSVIRIYAMQFNPPKIDSFRFLYACEP